MARVWIARALRATGYEDVAFSKGLMAVGWPDVRDLTLTQTREEIRNAVVESYPFVERASRESYANQLFAFRSEMAQGDTVLQLRRTSPDAAIGRVSGAYGYSSNLPDGIRHYRTVEWTRIDLPRSAVEAELFNMPALTMLRFVEDDSSAAHLRALAAESNTGTSHDADGSAASAIGGTKPDLSKPWVNLQQNLNHSRSLATAGQNLAHL